MLRLGDCFLRLEDKQEKHLSRVESLFVVVVSQWWDRPLDLVILLLEIKITKKQNWPLPIQRPLILDTPEPLSHVVQG